MRRRSGLVALAAAITLLVIWQQWSLQWRVSVSSASLRSAAGLLALPAAQNELTAPTPLPGMRKSAWTNGQAAKQMESPPRQQQQARAEIDLENYAAVQRRLGALAATAGAVTMARVETAAQHSTPAAGKKNTQPDQSLVDMGPTVESLIRKHCLDAGGPQQWGGARTVKFNSCKLDGGQHFQLRPNGQLVSARDDSLEGLCLDGHGIAEGGHVHADPCDQASAGQRWTLALAEGTPPNSDLYGHLINEESQLCLTAPEPGYEVQMMECHAGCNQSWVVRHLQSKGHPRVGSRKPAWRQPVAHATFGGKVLCWIMTYPGNHATKDVAINATWGSRCDYTLFVSSQAYDNLPMYVAELPAPESRDMLWSKFKAGFLHIFHNYLDKVDWIVRTDDDSYLVMDNLRQLLARYDPAEPHFLGRRLKRSGQDELEFYSGGSGIVMSQGAVRKLGTAVIRDPKVWRQPEISTLDDFFIAMSFRNVDVFCETAVDMAGRQLFLPLGMPFEYTATRKRHPKLWVWKFSPEAGEGAECCSTRWAGAHYFRSADMYKMDLIERGLCVAHPSVWPYLQFDDQMPLPADLEFH